ncbi:Imm45 family immunity protein [Pseudomonas batumici]|uniref:Imm45 family immunity protein n=1 Tax=Pseudomonas batumici TaxID=226910 RepID=UPI000A03D9FE
MLQAVKLVDYEGDAISRGQIFRLPASWPYESIVDFMVVDIPGEQCGHSIIVSSGNKSGLVLVQLPIESRSLGHGISKKWIVENWAKWIYPECPVESVYIFDRAEAPVQLTVS